MKNRIDINAERGVRDEVIAACRASLEYIADQPWIVHARTHLHYVHYSRRQQAGLIPCAPPHLTNGDLTGRTYRPMPAPPDGLHPLHCRVTAGPVGRLP